MVLPAGGVCPNDTAASIRTATEAKIIDLIVLLTPAYKCGVRELRCN
jgi:hypothetical protein